MSLVRLLYVSHLAKGCGPDELGKILEVSRRNNRKNGVTGALCYSARGFLQCLEGPAAAVNQLYRTIARDDRHLDVTLLDYADIQTRAFGDWSMAYVREDEIDRKILKRIRGAESFDPFDMAAGEAMDLLKEVVRERKEFLARQQAASED
ncbi:MAG: Blue light- and temperature-regulated antirepressor YcgF [Verrucomicrobia bacterium ADurb.Bin345]|nr:MAG: Blue light- and temperature-regulated antirepressor YcgF [Verrucomicrobia bacterium ADurb.Bin345]